MRKTGSDRGSLTLGDLKRMHVIEEPVLPMSLNATSSSIERIQPLRLTAPLRLTFYLFKGRITLGDLKRMQLLRLRL